MMKVYNHFSVVLLSFTLKLTLKNFLKGDVLESVRQFGGNRIGEIYEVKVLNRRPHKFHYHHWADGSPQSVWLTAVDMATFQNVTRDNEEDFRFGMG